MSLLLLLRPLAAPVGPQPPSITGFVPISGPVGTIVVISGFNFTAATDISFHGTSAITFNVDSALQITATVPFGATTGTISVTTAIGTGTSAQSFTVTVPVIVSTTSARAKKRKQVRIRYEDFQRNPEFLKSFLQLPEFDESNNAAKAEEVKRIAKREAKMRARAAALEAAEESRLRALTAQIDKKLDSEKAAEVERKRISSINNAIIMMMLTDES